MTYQEIIDSIFHTYTDDTTELSTAEELALADRISKQVARSRPWEILKTPKTGTLSTTVPYVALPSDFMFMAENNQSTNNAVAINNNAVAKVVFVGSNYKPYQVINFSDRRQYLNRDGYCYLDMANSRLVFTLQPTAADSYEYDYLKVPPDATLGGTPWMPTDFQPIIGFGMAADGFMQQLFDKARSYAEENIGKYNSYLADMAYWNANLRAD